MIWKNLPKHYHHEHVGETNYWILLLGFILYMNWSNCIHLFRKIINLIHEMIEYYVSLQNWCNLEKKMLSKMLWWCWIYVSISSWPWLEVASYKVYQYSMSHTSIHVLKQNCKHIFLCPLFAKFKSIACQFEHSHILSSS